MTTSQLHSGGPDPVQQPSGLYRTTAQLVALLLVAGLAWMWTASQAQSMGAMTGTMGLGLPAFIVMWTLMMTAMMLPSVSPLVMMYARTIQSLRALRLTTFATGYLLVWGASSLPAFALAWVAGEAAGRPRVGTAVAVAILGANGIYQLTPLKTVCLSHCRSPISHLFHYASYTGRLRDLRAGVHNGYYCFGCCWSLMALMAAFGVMNLAAMVALAAVVAVEKLSPGGDRFSKAIGVASLVAAVAVIWMPGIAPGLSGETMVMGS